MNISTSFCRKKRYVLRLANESRAGFISDPLGRPTVMAGGDHCFRTCCSFISLGQKQNKFQAKATLTTSETVGLAEWIIDDTCLVHDILQDTIIFHFPNVWFHVPFESEDWKTSLHTIKMRLLRWIIKRKTFLNLLFLNTSRKQENW